jgi:hypothetical protein
MHYMTYRSHKMQKHKFGVTCPNVLLMETASGPPKHENSVSMFCTPEPPECTM